MMLRRRKKPRTKARDPLRVPGHYQWVGGFPCCVPGCGAYPVDRHHITHDVEWELQGGMGRKNHDRLCIPLCRTHHNEVDAPGSSAYAVEAKYGFSMRKVADHLWQISRAGQRYRAEQRERERA